MSELKEYFKRILKHVENKYSNETEGSKEILADYDIETAVATDYNGRQIFEMLQNADDASQTAINKKILFTLKDNELRISNNGIPFTSESFDSITYIGNSPKRGDNSSTGEKGLGFRSYLNWSNNLTIESGGEKVSFSKTYAKSFVKNILDRCPKVRENFYQKKHKYNDEFPVSILRIPYIHESDITNNEYDTTITLSLNDEKVVEDVCKQFERITPYTLLFTKFIEEIEIITTNTKVFKKTTEGDKVVITEYIDNIKTNEWHWNIRKKKGTIKEKEYELIVAWNDNLTNDETVLYSYFKTNVKFPFPILVNGSFDLMLNRNQLNLTDYNTELFHHLIDLMLEVAEIIAKKTKGYTALKLLSIDFEKISSDISAHLDFSKTLKEKVLKSKLFPTVNGYYISSENQPIYYKDFRSSILKGDDVKNLLLECDNPIIIGTYLNKFDKYNIDYLVDIIHNRLNNICIDDYCNLLLLLQRECNYNNICCYSSLQDEYAKKYPNKSFPTLLYDEYGKQIPQNNKKIAKENNIQIDIPDELEYNFVHQDILSKIKEKENYNTNSILLLYKILGIETFSYETIANDLIKIYNNKISDNTNNPKDYIMLLHKALYSLFKQNKNIVLTHYPYALTKDTEQTFRYTSELYYGEEYDCNLNNIIFDYDKSLLLAKKDLFGFEGIDDTIIIEYFDWLKVAKYPRIISVSIKRDDIGYKDYIDYFDYLFKSIDCSNVGIDFCNYDNYKKRVFWVDSIEISDIQHFENILYNNKSETILSWVLEDANLRNLLEKNIEPSESYIKIDKSNIKYLRKIYYIHLLSFIKWKFSQSSWLTCRTGRKVKPVTCTMSETINDEFSPYIEKPSVDTKSKIFKEYLEKGNRLNTAYELVGVNSKISDFDSEIIYSILNILPEKDTNGEKAKKIYKQLTENYDSKRINKSGRNYLEYTIRGKVFCKKGKEEYYLSHINVYYVNNKQYGDCVTSQFNTITIPPKLNAQRIKDIFCIEKIKFDDFHINGSPSLHVLNKEFEREIESFKPYVYIFRKDKDQDGNDKSQVKNSKFKLVNNLSYTFKKDDELFNADLDDFDFFTDKNSKCTYIRIPENIYSYDIIRHDVKLGNAIAEAFSAMFNIETMSDIRELFGQNISGRNDIIRAHFNDPQLIELEKTKELLGVVSNYKLNFWRSFVNCFPDKALNNTTYEDKELIDELHRLFPEYSDLIDSVDKYIIDDDSIFDSDISAVKCIVELLKSSNVSLEQFNKYAYPNISINKLYKNEFGEIIEKNDSIVKSAIYSKLCSQPDAQYKFRKLTDKYKSLISSVTIPSNVNYDIVTDFNNTIKREFDINLDNDTEIIDFEGLYNNNLQLVIDEASKNKIGDNAVVEYINESNERSSLLFFEQGTQKLLEEIIQKLKPSNPETTVTTIPLTVAGKFYSYKNIKDIIKQISESGVCLKDSDIYYVSIHNPHTNPSNGNSGNNRKSYSTRNIGNIRRTEKEFGCIGEKIVYDYLKNNAKYSDVKWVSAYATECGENPFGSDGLGYDIEYNDGKRKKYVEVKTSISGGNVILISPNEVKKGEELKDDYEIFIVRDVKSHPKIEIIKSPFKYPKGYSFNNNEKFEIEIKEYALRFEKE